MRELLISIVFSIVCLVSCGKNTSPDDPEQTGEVNKCKSCDSAKYACEMTNSSLSKAVEEWTETRAEKVEEAKGKYGPINQWDTSKVTTMDGLFEYLNFNENIGCWDTSNVTSMIEMFSENLVFNQDIGEWKTGKVKNMESMFHQAMAFNQYIGEWDTASVENMESMFDQAKVFNQDIGKWKTGNLKNMQSMFSGAKNFNQNLNKWSLENVTEISYIFNEATNFKNGGKDLTWELAGISDGNKYQIFENSGLKNDGTLKP